MQGLLGKDQRGRQQPSECAKAKGILAGEVKAWERGELGTIRPPRWEDNHKRLTSRSGPGGSLEAYCFTLWTESVTWGAPQGPAP